MDEKINKRKKRIINLTADSAMGLMQEIYIELCEQRSIAMTIQKKMMALMKDAQDIQLLGPIIKDQQKILTDTSEKKIALAKIQASLMLKQDGGGKDKPLKSLTLSAEDRDLFEKIINEKEE